MKRYIISLFLILATWQSASAMSYEHAREEALYLTDKMAYELNLNDQQYNDAYEINLDYFLSLDSEADLYADYLSYRLSDLRHILYDWQYNLMLAADYFIRPVYWRSGGWYFPIYSHYTVGHFYYSYPTVYYSYRGGHGRIHYHGGFYASRRPVWNGGLRGHHPTGGRGRIDHSGIVQRHDGGRNGYHIEFDRHSGGRSDRGNSFGNSSTRNHEGYSHNREGMSRNQEGITRNNEGISRNREGYSTTQPRSYNDRLRGSYSGSSRGNYNESSRGNFGGSSRSYSGGSRSGGYSSGGSRGGYSSGGLRGGGGGGVSRGRR